MHIKNFSLLIIFVRLEHRMYTRDACRMSLSLFIAGEERSDLGQRFVLSDERIVSESWLRRKYHSMFRIFAKKWRVHPFDFGHPRHTN